MIRFITKYLGWRNWSVLVYNSVIENMFVICFIALADHRYSWAFIADFFIFFICSTFCTSYGYLINDYADRTLDRLHGKQNTFQDVSGTQARLVVACFFCISIATAFPFFHKPLFPLLWFIWVGMASIYSLPPFRLKERGTTGLISVVVAQRMLPALLVFAAFAFYRWVDMAVLTAYVLLRGLSSDLNHQLNEADRDTHTGTATHAVRAGFRKVRTFFRISLEAEKCLLVIGMLRMTAATWPDRIAGIPVLLPLCLFCIAAYALSIITMAASGGVYDVNPFRPGRKDVFQFLHHAFPSVLMPLYMLTILTVQQPLYVLPLLLCALLHRLYSIEVIRNSFPFHLLQHIMVRSTRT